MSLWKEFQLKCFPLNQFYFQIIMHFYYLRVGKSEKIDGVDGYLGPKINAVHFYQRTNNGMTLVSNILVLYKFA